MSRPNRAYVAAHFALELDQQRNVGLFKAIEGGGAKQETLKYQNGGEALTYYSQGRLKFEDFKVSVGMSMSRVFYDWIANFFRGVPDRKTGAVVAADFYYKERARREFDQAMITEVTFPKLSGDDKGACYLQVTIKPENIIYTVGSGQEIQQNAGFDKQKLWAACNFDFRIDGFEQASRRVITIESFSLKQKPVEYADGMTRTPILVPGRVEYPKLVFTLPEADAKPFVEWHDKYAVIGNIPPEERLHGEINTYDNQQRALFTVQFQGGLIENLVPDKSDASSEDVKKVKVEMQTESMTFQYK